MDIIIRLSSPNRDNSLVGVKTLKSRLLTLSKNQYHLQPESKGFKVKLSRWLRDGGIIYFSLFKAKYTHGVMAKMGSLVMATVTIKPHPVFLITKDVPLLYLLDILTQPFLIVRETFTLLDITVTLD